MTARRWSGATLGVLLFVGAAVYRFNLLGGVLGGFQNDEFMAITPAANILRGDWPSRDFVDFGVPLVYAASAAALWLRDGTLAGYAVLAVVMLALGAVLTFKLAAEASGSLLLGAAAALLQIALAPRAYNYPKIVLYALAVLAWWRYLDRPTAARVVWLAMLTAIAFLFRHDHGVYIALGSVVVLIAGARQVGARQALHRLALYAVVGLVAVSPYLLYLERTEGVLTHLRVGADYSRVDRAHTELRRPRIAIDGREPLFGFNAPPSLGLPRVNIKWADGLAPERRAALEARFRIDPQEQLSPEVWAYAVRDDSRQNLRRLTTDPAVVDTQNIDRGAFTIVERPSFTRWQSIRLEYPVLRLRVLPGVATRENAVAALYYIFQAVPLLVALRLFWLWRSRDEQRRVEVARLLPLVVIAVVLNVWFLRSQLPARLPDASVMIGILGAWLLASLVRDARRRGLAIRAVTVAFVTAASLLVAVSAIGAGRMDVNVVTVTDGAGLAGIIPRIRRVYRLLDTAPSQLAEETASISPTMRLAAYLNRCTQPEDRVFVTGYRSEVFYFAERRFAGGQVALRGGYSTAAADQELTVARLEAQRPPIVVTDAKAITDDVDRRDWPILYRFLDRQYREARERDFNGEVLSVLVRRDARATGVYEPLGLPCFAGGARASN